MKPSVEQLGNLLALKRNERPEEAYWQDFLCEFHQRQREQAVKKSGIAGIISRMAAWFSDLGPSKWAYGAGLAYAAATVAFFLAPRSLQLDDVTTPTVPVNRVIVEPTRPVEQLDRLDLDPSTEGSVGEQIF